MRPPAVTAAAPAAPAASRPKPSPARPGQAPIAAPQKAVSAPQTPITAPGAPALASGAAACEPEDLPLLTDAEKVRCRNQIDAEKGRRLARGADERAARQVAEAERGPQTYRMATEKEAYYAAVAQAYWEQSSHGPPMAGHMPGIGCGIPLASIPLLGGADINKNHLAKKKQETGPPNSLKLGPLPCYLMPPQGLFSEESGLNPLDPQWLPKH